MPTPPQSTPRRMPRAAAKRSATAWTLVALAALVAIYALLAALTQHLPHGMQTAFRWSVARWVFLGSGVAGTVGLAAAERRRARAATALAGELLRAQDLERRADDAVALTEASRGLNRAAPEHIMESVARGAAVTVGALRACMFAHDEDNNVMVPIGWTAGATFEPQEMDSIVGRSAIRRQPILTNDPPPSTVCAPVIVGGELAGVVFAVAEGKRFGDRELKLIASYATDASVAIARARALEQERKVAERMQEVDRAKSDFVAAVSHELKTPLTSLLGYASILRKRVDALPKERREQFFEIMQRQGERILKLIGELLESSRMESGLARMRREHIPLKGLIATVVKDMKPAAKRHAIEVSVPEEDPGLWGDPAAVEHVLINLIDNAIKYSPKRTTVRVMVESRPSEITLAVSDEGHGIAPEDLPHIFERFRQGDDIERTRNSVGLGLFIVRSLVEAQGGMVACESQIGRGSTFTVTFPRRAQDRAAREAQAAEAAERAAKLAPKKPEPKKPAAKKAATPKKKATLPDPAPAQAEMPPAPDAPDEEPVITIGSSNGSIPESSIDADTLRAIAESHEGSEPRRDETSGTKDPATD